MFSSGGGSEEGLFSLFQEKQKNKTKNTPLKLYAGVCPSKTRLWAEIILERFNFSVG